MCRRPVVGVMEPLSTSAGLTERAHRDVIAAWVGALDMNEEEAADFERWYRQRYGLEQQ